jgi:hypothetical protein
VPGNGIGAVDARPCREKLRIVDAQLPHSHQCDLFPDVGIEDVSIKIGSLHPPALELARETISLQDAKSVTGGIWRG